MIVQENYKLKRIGREVKWFKNRSKQVPGFDAFSTLQCRPQILWNTNTNPDKTKDNFSKQQLSIENFEDDKEQKEIKIDNVNEFKTDFEKAMAMKEKMLNSIRSIDIDRSIIDYYLDDKNKLEKIYKVPRLAELHPVLKLKLEEKLKNDWRNEKKKIYSLSDVYLKLLN